MKYVGAVRFMTSWPLYWAGHVVSLSPVGRLAWGFRLYGWLILWSHDVQGETPYGPWRPVEMSESE